MTNPRPYRSSPCAEPPARRERNQPHRCRSRRQGSGSRSCRKRKDGSDVRSKHPGGNLMRTVTSADSTTIAYEQTGDGPPVILVGGAFNDRTRVAALAAELAPALTAICYDRRGRGDSGDAAGYAVEREIEDLAALVEHAGGEAAVFGHSSGAILALEAARQGVAMRKLVVYEPPYVMDDSRLRALLGQDRRATRRRSSSQRRSRSRPRKSRACGARRCGRA